MTYDEKDKLAEVITRKFFLYLVFILMSPFMLVGVFVRFAQAGFLNGVKMYDLFSTWIEGG